MIIYLISLEDDLNRRSELAKRFPETYPKMNWIKAINGKKIPALDYFNYTSKFCKKYQRVLTPSEVGCSLSHINALKNFLETNEKYALILEDDILGEDETIDKLECFFKQYKFEGVCICSSQDMHGKQKYILAKPVNNSNVYCISAFSIEFFYQTSAYLISREAAKLIIWKQEHFMHYADAWSFFMESSNLEFLYTKEFKHPVDVALDSNIESERSVFRLDENFFKRVLEQGVFWKVYNRIRNDIISFILILLGFKRIK
jgi:glycosyl transferase family 25